MQCLLSQVQYFNPKEVIIIGDMCHSDANKELDFFVRWRRDIAKVPIKLIKGNHDILKKEWYINADIEVVNDSLTVGQFVFTHDAAPAKIEAGEYIFSGHVHPGVSIHGLGRQSLQFPCFYFGEQHAILPAFSKFTGMYNIRPAANEVAYAVIEDTIVAIKGKG